MVNTLHKFCLISSLYLNGIVARYGHYQETVRFFNNFFYYKEFSQTLNLFSFRIQIKRTKFVNLTNMIMMYIITMIFTTLMIHILIIYKEMITFCKGSLQEIFLIECFRKSKTLSQESTTCVLKLLNHVIRLKLIK